MVTLLGGRAAEEEVFGESYSGAVDDLARVHMVCRQMVAEFGMGVALDHDGPPPIAMPTDDYAVSDATRRDADLAAMTLAREAYRRSRALLAANRGCLEDLAAGALERETLTREELLPDFRRPQLRGPGRASGLRGGAGRPRKERAASSIGAPWARLARRRLLLPARPLDGPPRPR